MKCDACPIKRACELEKEIQLSNADIPLPSWRKEVREDLEKFCPLEHLIKQTIYRRIKAKLIELELKG